MQPMTLDQLKDLMRSCADTGEELDLSGDILDRRFGDMDFDSLAVLELATRIQQDSGVHIPDDAIEGMTTPRGVLNYVNTQRAEV